MNTVSVVYSDEQGDWLILGNEAFQGRERLKQDAEKKARELAKENRPSELVVERMDRGVSYTQRYE